MDAAVLRIAADWCATGILLADRVSDSVEGRGNASRHSFLNPQIAVTRPAFSHGRYAGERALRLCTTQAAAVVGLVRNEAQQQLWLPSEPVTACGLHKLRRMKNEDVAVGRETWSSGCCRQGMRVSAPVCHARRGEREREREGEREDDESCRCRRRECRLLLRLLR